MQAVYSIELFGMTFSEPMTLLTDLILAAFCFVFWKRLRNFSNNADSELSWRKFFLFMGISTTIGGFAHFLNLYTGITLHLLAWSFSILSLYYIGKTAIEYMPIKYRKKVLTIARIQALVFLVLIFWQQRFGLVVINTVINLAGIVLAVNFYQGLKYKNKSSWIVILAVLMTATSTILLSPQYAVNEWFSHKDLAHLALVLCMWVFYMASKKEIKLSLKVH